MGSLFKNADNDSYEVGILVDQLLYLGARGKMVLDRGPWDSTEEYLIGLVRSTSTFLDHPDAPNDDDYDERHVDRIRNACQRLEEAIPTFPSFQLMDVSLERFCLQHTGLHSENIMVDGTKVTGIIEWEEAGVYPAWVFGESPRLVSGPDVIDDGVHGGPYYQEEHLWLLEKTKYRHFFYSGIDGWNQEFKAVVEGVGELVRCKAHTNTLRYLPRDTMRWLRRLESGRGEESDDGEESEESEESEDSDGSERSARSEGSEESGEIQGSVDEDCKAPDNSYHRQMLLETTMIPTLSRAVATDYSCRRSSCSSARSAATEVSIAGSAGGRLILDTTEAMVISLLLASRKTCSGSPIAPRCFNKE